MMKNKKLKLVELFGGIGAIRKALIDLNIDFEVVDYVENNNNAVKAYNLIYDDDRKVLDVKDYHLPKKINIDLLFHGSPCQDFSIAGKNEGGIKGSNTRSSLLWETIRIIDEAENKPSIVIWENVKNVLSKKHINVFKEYLKKMEELGYKSSYKIINALDCGVPQNRERIFTVSILEKQENEDKYDWIDRFEKDNDYKLKKLKEILEKEVDRKYFLNFKIMSMLKAVVNKKIKIVNGIFTSTITTTQWRWNNAGVVKIPLTTFNSENYILDLDNETTQARTLTAVGVNSRQKIAICSSNLKEKVDELAIFLIDDKKYYLRVITPKEAMLLMGFSSDDYHKLENNLSDNQIYKVAGNSIVVDCLKRLVNSIFI